MEALPPVSETSPRPEQWPDPAAARSRAEAGSTPLGATEHRLEAYAMLHWPSGLSSDLPELSPCT
jgi:hypothetical protein